MSRSDEFHSASKSRRSITSHDEKGDSMFTLRPGHGLKVGQEVRLPDKTGHPDIVSDEVLGGDREAWDRMRTHVHGLRYITGESNWEDNTVTNVYKVKKIHGWRDFTMNSLGAAHTEFIDHAMTRRFQKGAM